MAEGGVDGSRGHKALPYDSPRNAGGLRANPQCPSPGVWGLCPQRSCSCLIDRAMMDFEVVNEDPEKAAGRKYLS